MVKTAPKSGIQLAKQSKKGYNESAAKNYLHDSILFHKRVFFTGAFFGDFPLFSWCRKKFVYLPFGCAFLRPVSIDQAFFDAGCTLTIENFYGGAAGCAFPSIRRLVRFPCLHIATFSAALCFDTFCQFFYQEFIDICRDLVYNVIVVQSPYYFANKNIFIS